MVPLAPKAPGPSTLSSLPHPSQAFRIQCATVVLGGCTPVAVPASALKVRLVVTPSVVSKSADSAQVEVRVRATNPRWRPVIVDLGPPPAAGEDPPRNSKFSAAWTIEAIDSASSYGGQNNGMWGQRVFRFGPRSTRSAVFHLPINSTARPGWDRALDIPPGEYRITGSVGTQPAPPVRLIVRP